MTVLNLRVITVTVSIIIKSFKDCNYKYDYFFNRIFSATFFGTGSYLSKNME